MRTFFWILSIALFMTLMVGSWNAGYEEGWSQRGASRSYPMAQLWKINYPVARYRPPPKDAPCYPCGHRI